ncbi:MAG TPA: PfkB family carbohydrate kinase [Stellaceae bacterium]|jgi:sugar/nucleoside kinase (ribokinase family)|nr:PfkB family carbohydrate kinase [Stellaceae bacterium]
MVPHRPRRLISAGSIVADVRVAAPHLPVRGGDVVTSSATMAAGGGFNILSAAARQGLATLFAGRHGVGPYGDCIRAALAREGIAMLLPPDGEGDSGFCFVIVEPDGERSFITSPGVEARLGRRRFGDIPLRAGDAVFVSGYDLCYPALGPAIAAWIAALPGDVLLVVDPGPLVADIPSGIRDTALSRAGILTLNRREAQLFAEAEDTDEMLRRLRLRLARDVLLVMRDGADGCHISGAGVAAPGIHLSPPAVVAVDTTGAGDTHTGVLIASLADQGDVVAAATRANVAAALSVTRPGPATSPTKQEVDAFLAETKWRVRRTIEIT